MPAGATVGSLVIVQFTTGANSTYTWPAGWTSLLADTANGTAMQMGMRYRIFDGSGSDACTITTSTSVESASVAIRVTGYDIAAPCIALASTVDFGSDPEPPASNPGVAADYKWIAGFGADDDDDTAIYWSTSYTGVAQVESSTNAASCLCAMEYRDLNASTTNPGGMHMAAEEDYVVYTFAINPGSGGEGGGTAKIKDIIGATGIIPFARV